MKVGRYCIVTFDQHLVDRMRSIARHVYSVLEIDKEKFICEFDLNPKPEKVLITDFRIALTSSHDRMSWKTVERDFLLIKDRTIIY